MEANTTPQPSGFSGKPKSKFRKSSRGKNSRRKNAGKDEPRFTQKETIAMIYGFMSMMAAHSRLTSIFGPSIHDRHDNASAK